MTTHPQIKANLKNYPNPTENDEQPSDCDAFAHVC
jgi:hypothetical protein